MKALLISLILLITPRLAMACSCGGSTSPCGSFYAAEAVFVGTVSRVENKTIKGDGGEVVITGQTAYVEMEESFKGVKASEMIFRSYGTSCDPVYEEGQRWLFYAYFNKKEKAWEIHACDRSTLIESAPDDLLYLRNLPASAQKARIAGTIRNSAAKPMMGLKVKVTDGRKVYKAFTDKNGVYEILGLPPGKYSIEPEVPFTMKVHFAITYGELDLINRKTRELTLKEKGCAGMNFYFNENTSVSGKVFGVDGRPFQNACVHLLLKDSDNRSYLGDCTKADGSFKIDEIPLGDYVVVVNESGQISSHEPFPSVYYPGVLDKEKATVLTVASGDQQQDVDIHIPTEKPTHTIEGRLLYSDGRPVPGGTIEFMEAVARGKPGEQVGNTSDSNGRFSLTVLAGLKGSLRSYTLAFTGQFTPCAKLKEFNKGTRYMISTNIIKLETNMDYRDLELKYPFPDCSKIKDPQR